MMTPTKNKISNRAWWRCRLLLAVLSAFWGGVAAASVGDEPEALRPVTSIFTVDLGHASILDTYISPVRYGGFSTRLGYERMQAMKFNPQQWVMQLDAAIDYAPVKNPAGNHTVHSLAVDAKWGMMRRWHDVLVPGLQLMAGGDVQLRGGVIYSSYNANNPVSVKIHASAGLMGLASYNVKVGRVPVTLRYQATLPVVGAFFSPDYGEAFYEIYVGNHGGLAHFGWWANRFDMVNLVTTDWHLGSTVLRIGYRNRVETSWINNLRTQMCSHGIVFGVGGEWISLGRDSRVSDDAVRISALY